MFEYMPMFSTDSNRSAWSFQRLAAHARPPNDDHLESVYVVVLDVSAHGRLRRRGRAMRACQLRGVSSRGIRPGPRGSHNGGAAEHEALHGVNWFPLLQR